MPLLDGIKSRYLGMVFFCVFVPLAGENIQASEFTPANFKSEGIVGIEIFIDEISDEISEVFVPCQTMVEINGLPTNYSCIVSFIDKHAVFAQAVMIAIPKQSFIAAKVDSEAVRVLMNFTVIFICKEGKCTTTTSRNHLFHKQELGLTYVAPQPIVTSDNWYDGFKNKLSWSKELRKYLHVHEGWWGHKVSQVFFRTYYPGYRISAEIGIDGAVKNKLVENTIATWVQKRSDRAAASLSDVKYIPGFDNNEPVTMQLYEQGMIKRPCDGSYNTCGGSYNTFPNQF